MGIGLALFQVDHENVIVRGLPLLNDGLRCGDLDPLRRFLAEVPFEEPKDRLDFLYQRLARLREVDAPPMIVANEERRLASARRPTREALDLADADDLRLLLGRWNSEARTLDLDKSWDLMHWYCDAGRRSRNDGDWRGRLAAPSLFDMAFHGSDEPPRDALDRPLLADGGTPSEGYNPPAVVQRVAAALAEVGTDGWDVIDADLERLPDAERPYLGTIDERLEYARHHFPRLVHFYQDAAHRGFGVSVEYY